MFGEHNFFNLPDVSAALYRSGTDDDEYSSDEADIKIENDEPPKKEPPHDLKTPPRDIFKPTTTTHLQAFNVNETTNCKNITIPKIPIRCLLDYEIGDRIGGGQGAVVYALENINQVIRISHLVHDDQKFEQDVKVRYLLACKCKKLPITTLKDAFICDKSGERYGATISEKFDGDLMYYMEKILQTKHARVQFLNQLRTDLPVLVNAMHLCKVVHLDISTGNVLVRMNPDKKVLVRMNPDKKLPVYQFALTDFEHAVAPGLLNGQDLTRVMPGYKLLDKLACKEVLATVTCKFEELHTPNATTEQCKVSTVQEPGQLNKI
jgi:serine/threonine protein kinase